MNLRAVCRLTLIGKSQVLTLAVMDGFPIASLALDRAIWNSEAARTDHGFFAFSRSNFRMLNQNVSF